MAQHKQHAAQQCRMANMCRKTVCCSISWLWCPQEANHAHAALIVVLHQQIAECEAAQSLWLRLM